MLSKLARLGVQLYCMETAHPSQPYYKSGRMGMREEPRDRNVAVAKRWKCSWHLCLHRSDTRSVRVGVNFHRALFRGQHLGGIQVHQPLLRWFPIWNNEPEMACRCQPPARAVRPCVLGWKPGFKLKQSATSQQTASTCQPQCEG